MMDERDAQIADLICREIDKARDPATAYDWPPHTPPWYRALGEIYGMYRILQLVDREAKDVLPALPIHTGD